MTAVAFCKSGLAVLKLQARNYYPGSRSSHLSEAIAAGMGFRTHASLLTQLSIADASDPDYIEFNDEAMVTRLRQLDADSVPDEELDWTELCDFDDPKLVRPTRSDKYYQFAYHTNRWRAWRNIMVATINAGIEQRLFTILPDDNRWPGSRPSDPRRGADGFVFRFEVGGVPGLGYVADGGFDELMIYGALWPTDNAQRLIRAIGLRMPGFAPGQAVAAGWLERRDGAWLQTSNAPRLSCRNDRLGLVAELHIPTRGYADRGNRKL